MTRYRWYIDRDPFLGEFAKLQREMTRLWDQVYPREGSTREVGVFPLVNVWEDHDNYYVGAEIPGVEDKDLDITAVADGITIKGERKTDADGDVNYHRRERSAGKFSRVITMGGRIDPDKVQASLKNGVLLITIGKAEEAKPKAITIKSS
jgi:HSP20 family protein